MDREIKFRAWDKKSNKMLQNNTKFVIWEDGSWSCKDGFTNTSLLINEDFAVLMQYTGLKDKNGVEIYEGDILGYTIANRIVMWSGDNASFVSCRELRKDGTHGNYITFDRQEADVREVIGNIHENPELVEG